MSFRNNVQSTARVDDTGFISDFSDQHPLAQAGLVVGVGAGGFGAGVLIAALPAQMLTAATLSGGLIYAGNRMKQGLSVNPFASSDDSTAPVTAADQGLGVAVDSGLDASKLPAVATA